MLGDEGLPFMGEGSRDDEVGGGGVAMDLVIGRCGGGLKGEDVGDDAWTAS